MENKKVKKELLSLQRWLRNNYSDCDCTWSTVKHDDGEWIKWEDLRKIIKKL